MFGVYPKRTENSLRYYHEAIAMMIIIRQEVLIRRCKFVDVEPAKTKLSDQRTHPLGKEATTAVDAAIK